MLEGKFYLIKHVGTKWKFYWAPYEPAPERDFEDWGVAVIDTSWKIKDQRPKHLRAKPLDYQLQPWVQILRDPNVYSEKLGYCGKDWRGYSLNSNIFRGLIHADKHHRRILSVGVQIEVFDNKTPKKDCSFFYKENL
ncbi:MAG: hypothetical protein LKF01_04600 [Lactobacillus sp.]|jgi:hypothetical protein|nr:hypothetical protein [Lactobacillus sp.]MCH3905902.1 hypothetical protein [Lactobacillus sp.]MCH3990522.1 hypothetical protein [Lactobacillus sp.]MCH4068763.1 hypothetical protein [Lactobacillus sp.]MCI1303752.1 hypothetical protein [Lactobacillus sp.]